jgi:sugar phosphate permease
MTLLFNNKIFIFLSLSLAGLYFVITGIQYWLSQYLEVVLEIER